MKNKNDNRNIYNKSKQITERLVVVAISIICFLTSPVQGGVILAPNSMPWGTITEDTHIYKYRASNEVVGDLHVGDIVEILSEHSSLWYEIKTRGELTGFIERSFLDIHIDNRVDDSLPTSIQWETFVNQMGLKSASKFLVVTDISRQKVLIFQGEREDWSLIKTFTCSTGKSETPTKRGLYHFSERGEWFYSKRLESGARYWIRYYDSYLFHSVAMDENKQIVDPIIGERRSDGCVRLELEDIKWIYKNVPDKSTVYIY